MRPQKFDLWLKSTAVSNELKSQMREMSEEDIIDSFSKDIEFGTAGLRGIMGPGTNRMNIITIRKASFAFGSYLLDLCEHTKRRGIVIAYDNRNKSNDFGLEAAKVFTSLGIKTYMFDKLTPTPQLSYTVRKLNAIGGVVITASHNPKQYNGYKVYDNEGCQLVPQKIEKLYTYFKAIDNELNIFSDDSKLGELLNILPDVVSDCYYEDVLKIRLNKGLDTSKLRIVYTPEHGTGLNGVKFILKKAGYDLHVVKNQANPDPNFTNTLSPNPEDHKAYEGAIELAKKIKADIILATDPDADRLGVVVNKENDSVYLTGNQVGALLIDYIIKTKKHYNDFNDKYVLYNTIVTGGLGAKIASLNGVRVFSTLTGFKFIGDQIRKLVKEDKEKFLFGYEESYGFLLNSMVRDKDALQACLIISEMACYYKNQNLTLDEVLDNLYKEHGYYLESIDSLTYEGLEGSKKITSLMEKLRSNKLSTLGGKKVIAIEDYSIGKKIYADGSEELLQLPESNVLRYILQGDSFVAIRPSGTEPKCKFYYNLVEKDSTSANALLESIKKQIKDII
ncbi:MAG: phospho-sugar mutase [Bacilli bacterium]|nr:phospho-sugar mutase [Bacilli bacterium]